MGKNIISLPALQSLSSIQPAAFAHVPAFTPVLASYMNFLSRLPTARYVSAGTVLIRQGCSVRTIHLVVRGALKLVHLSACGRESVAGLRSEGWYAGSTSALLNVPSVYTVRALTDCMIVRIPSIEFSRHLKGIPDMLDHFLAGLCFEVASQASLHAEMIAGSAEDRLDHFIRERQTVNPNRRTLDPLPILKQMEVAQLLSVTPEHLSRMLHKRRQASLEGGNKKGRRPRDPASAFDRATPWKLSVVR